MDNPETLTTLGRQDTGRKQTKHKNTTQHRKQSRMDNPWTLTTLGRQDTGRKQTKHKNTIQHRKQSRMDNPGTLTTLRRQDTGRKQTKHKNTRDTTLGQNKQNTKTQHNTENNQEWTTQGH